MQWILGAGAAAFILCCVVYILPNMLFERKWKKSTGTTIANIRVPFINYKYFHKADIMYPCKGDTGSPQYPYLETIKALRGILPLPGFILKPLTKLNLQYVQERQLPLEQDYSGIIVYLHGAGSISEDNSVLHQELVQKGYVVIRLSYTIDFSTRDDLAKVKNLAGMVRRVIYIEEEVSPVLRQEFELAMEEIASKYPSLFDRHHNKPFVMIAHSLGADAAFSLAASGKFPVTKLVNLDGTLMGQVRHTGVSIPQLHLSQSQGFVDQWHEASKLDDKLTEQATVRDIGVDYAKRIYDVTQRSQSPTKWIKIKGATHFTFTDFPFLLRVTKLAGKVAGSRATADRIRQYVHTFIEQGIEDVEPVEGDELLNY